LSLSSSAVSDTSFDEAAFFCKQCPSGADCTDPSVLKATPGFFLWETNDPNNFNITKNAKRLPPGYGAEPSSANASGRVWLGYECFYLIMHFVLHFVFISHSSTYFSRHPFSVRQGIRSNVSWLNPCRPGSNRQGECCVLCAVCVV
jgi:hypothetical protein